MTRGVTYAWESFMPLIPALIGELGGGGGIFVTIYLKIIGYTEDWFVKFHG